LRTAPGILAWSTRADAPRALRDAARQGFEPVRSRLRAAIWNRSLLHRNFEID